MALFLSFPHKHNDEYFLFYYGYFKNRELKPLNKDLQKRQNNEKLFSGVHFSAPLTETSSRSSMLVAYEMVLKQTFKSFDFVFWLTFRLFLPIENILADWHSNGL